MSEVAPCNKSLTWAFAASRYICIYRNISLVVSKSHIISVTAKKGTYISFRKGDLSAPYIRYSLHDMFMLRGHFLINRKNNIGMAGQKVDAHWAIQKLNYLHQVFSCQSRARQ